MTSDQTELLQRILTFDIDGSDTSALPFAARLARENGWSRAYADRVITEYKRFAFLAMTSGQSVCPSEDVDAAWHLHLTYTRSYWKRFCEGVLGRPLHHEPTKGGPAGAEKHHAMYAETLAAYKRAFGHEAPADIWTPARERFGDDLKHRVVNTARNWVIPKSPVKRAAQLAVLFATLTLVIPGCNGGLDPFALQGTDFLYFLIPMMIGAACIGRIIRSHHRGPEPKVDEEFPDLRWDQAAYLSGGSARLTTATIARLVDNGVAAVEGTRLVRGGSELLADATPAESAVRNALPFSNDATSIKPVAKAVEAAFDNEAKNLEEAGYLLRGRAWYGAVCTSLVPLGVVLLMFALPRFLMGVGGGKPFQTLAFATLAGTLGSMALIFMGFTALTRRGDRVLAMMQDRNWKLKTGAALGGDWEPAMAVALFGTVALAGSSLVALQTWYPRQVSDASGGCGTGGCSAGGDGGGCGGCGGGGCGGGD
jgi:uncharacterized protein (TIGR04222 family)